MIIVEGTDLLGKTTLCEKLVKDLNARDHSHVYSHLSKLPESFDHVQGYLPLCNRNVVYDRFYLSRQAYGGALKNQRVMTPEELHWLDGYTRLFGSYTVLVVSTEYFIRQQFAAKDRDEMYDVDSIVAVNEEYLGLTDHADFLITASDVQWPSHFCSHIIDNYLKRREVVDEMGPQIFRPC